MRPLEEARRSLGLSLRELAQRLRVSHQCLREIERGLRLPGPQLAQQIRQECGLDLPPREAGNLDSLKSLAQPAAFALARADARVWQACLKRYAYELDCLRPAPHIPDWLPHYLRIDSGLEVLSWCSLLSDGAEAGLSSPHELGFRHHSLLAEDGLPLGPRRMVHLYFEDHGLCLWPQASLQVGSHKFRLDALVLGQVRGQPIWGDFEIDGEGHGGNWDEARARALQLPEVRVNRQEVVSRLVLPRLLATFGNTAPPGRRQPPSQRAT